MKPASEFQQRVARQLEITIDTSSFAVAAAQIESALAPALGYEEAPPKPSTERQIAFGAALGLDVSKDSMKVASARIQEKLDERNAELITAMQLAPGVRVLWQKWGRPMTISSISPNGRLWFKGGNGNGAFPHQVQRLD